MSNDNPQLEFEFVVDDKPVNKALDNVVAKGEKTAKKVEEGFSGKDLFGTSKAIDLKNVLGEVGDSIGGVAGSVGKLGIAFGAAAVAGYAFKKALDLAIEGERLQQIENSFDAIAGSVGQDAGVMKSALLSAAGGVADFDDVLQASTAALTEFGAQANRLPELLEVARAASIRFGGTAEERYKQLVDSVASGNTKILRSMGLFIDASDEVDKFAKAAGRSKEEVTALGQRQAILNAVLEKSKTVFAGVNIEQGNTTTELAKLTVAYKDAGDGIKTYFADAFGPGLRSILSAVTSVFKATQGEVEKPKSALEQLDEKIATTQTRLGELVKEIENPGGVITRNGVQMQARSYEYLSEAIRKTGLALGDFQKQREALVKSAKGAEGDGTDPAFSDAEKKRKALEAEKTFQAQLLQAKQQADAIRFSNAQIGQELEEQEAVRREQAMSEHNNRLLQIAQTYTNEKGFTERQRNMLIEQENLRHQAAMETIDFEGFEKRKELSKQKSQELLAIEGALRSGLVSAVTSAFDFIAKSLDKGWTDWQGFGATILTILGDLAINAGIIMTGIGNALNALAASLASFNGAGAIAAGVALIGLGIALKALASGMGGSKGASGSVFESPSGGGVASGPGDSGTTFIPPEEQEAQGPKTEINVAVNGNVMGTTDRSLALALSELLSDQFSQQGLVIKGV